MEQSTWKELYNRSTVDERLELAVEMLKRIEQKKQAAYRITQAQSDRQLNELNRAWPYLPFWTRKKIRLQVAFCVFQARWRAWKDHLAQRKAHAVLSFLAWSEGQCGVASPLEILCGALLYFHFRLVKALRLM